jgi:hypothetical protein
VDVYDIDEDNEALLISRGAYLLNAGTTKASYDLYANDWILPKGHRLGVLVTSANAEWWTHVPTGQQVTVKKASIALPFVSCGRPRLIEGKPAIFLEDYRQFQGFPVSEAQLKQSTRSNFPVPGELNKCEPSGQTCLKDRLHFKIHQPERSRIVQVDAYIDGKHVKRKTGERVTTFDLKRPKGKRDFKLRIVTRAANGQRTISVRTYHRCTKTNPHTHTVKP